MKNILPWDYAHCLGPLGELVHLAIPQGLVARFKVCKAVEERGWESHLMISKLCACFLVSTLETVHCSL